MASDQALTESRFQLRPLYLQVRDALIARIGKGEWKPGTMIPNEVDLAREFELSLGTVRKALDLLERERVLTRKQGRGTFVNDQSSDGLVTRFESLRAANGEHLEAEAKQISAAEATANEDERTRLQLGARDQVYRLRRLHLHGGRPFMVEQVSLPTALFPGLLDRAIEHRIVVLAQRYGILLASGDERVTIARAPSVIADLLGIAPTTPVLLLDRLLLTIDGRPVEWRVAHCDLAGGFYLAGIA